LITYPTEQPSGEDAPFQRDENRGGEYAGIESEKFESAERIDQKPPLDPLIESKITLEATEDLIPRDFDYNKVQLKRSVYLASSWT
jgi:hypothetical protein